MKICVNPAEYTETASIKIESMPHCEIVKVYVCVHITKVLRAQIYFTAKWQRVLI